MSEELNAAIAWLTEYIDMREHVRSEPVHYLRKHLDAITAARARIAELEAKEDGSKRCANLLREKLECADKRIAELEAQLLATQRALVRLADACDRVQDWHDTRIGDALYLDIVEETRAEVAQADGKVAK